MAPWTSPSRREFLKVSGLGAAGSSCIRASPAPRRPPAGDAGAGGEPPAGWHPQGRLRRDGPHFDIHQGETMAVLCHLYNGLVTCNLATA